MSDHVAIAIEFVAAARPELREKFPATVAGAYKPTVFFQDAYSGKQFRINFANAHIFVGDFEIVEPLGMVRVFEAMWENSELLSCTLTEPRETIIET